MPKRLIPILSFITIWIGLSQSTVLACPCAGKTTLNEGLRKADVVFAGKAIAANREIWPKHHIEFDRYPPFFHVSEYWQQNRTVFEVTTVWKGNVFATTTVMHPLMRSYCGYTFDQGQEYLIYARWFHGELSTHLCLRVNKLSDAGEDLAALGVGRPPNPNPSPAANYIGKLIAIFLPLSVLGWATWRARRKYGVQKS